MSDAALRWQRAGGRRGRGRYPTDRLKRDETRHSRSFFRRSPDTDHSSVDAPPPPPPTRRTTTAASACEGLLQRRRRRRLDRLRDTIRPSRHVVILRCATWHNLVTGKLAFAVTWFVGDFRRPAAILNDAPACCTDGIVQSVGRSVRQGRRSQAGRPAARPSARNGASYWDMGELEARTPWVMWQSHRIPIRSSLSLRIHASYTGVLKKFAFRRYTTALLSFALLCIIYKCTTQCICLLAKWCRSLLRLR